VTDNRTLLVHPTRSVRGTLRVPGDKSISHRYVILGAIARGATEVANLAPGADVASTIACLRALGTEIVSTGPGALHITGRGYAGLHAPAAALDAGNSGTTMRLLAGVLAGRPFTSTLVGDASLSRRPMGRVIQPLVAMGAHICSREGSPPLEITGGGLRGVHWTSPVASAQVKSAVLLAGLTGRGTTTVVEPMPTRDHTERAFGVFGLAVSVQGTACTVEGGQEATAPAGTLEVPGDPSSAAVWAAAAAALPGSAVRLDDVALNPGRVGFIGALTRMGASIEISERRMTAGEPIGRLTVRHASHQATTIDPSEVPGLIDELPVLAARAALGGGLEVSGAGELRLKESDRIAALVGGLRQLGVDVDERHDGFVVRGTRPPAGGTVDAAGDHRLVMAFALVGLGATGPTTITGAGAVDVSYPTFARELAEISE
jgi:3-phosphoshikimate 1-carboxyvinyltransferase